MKMVHGEMYVGKPPITMVLRIWKEVDDESLLEFAKNCCEHEKNRLVFLRGLGEAEPQLFLTKGGEFIPVKYGDFLIKENGILFVANGEYFLEQYRPCHS